MAGREVTEDCLTPVISTHGDQTSKQEAEQISNQTVVTRSSSCADSECVFAKGQPGIRCSVAVFQRPN
jgi:hypothetical protein